MIKLKKYGKIIYTGKSIRGWKIIIMPDEIRIDDYYKPSHVHVQNKGIHIPIKYKDYEETGLILELHLKKNKGINLKELIEELL
ncbi:MAG: hypothetical protein LBM26_00130 [Methanobrevibacter sp.]|jgi:hypothetical protein|nr:hypothetical protein [Methanobrevibacter sp.]